MAEAGRVRPWRFSLSLLQILLPTQNEARDRQYADEQMKEFEKASQRGQAIRNAGSALATREAALRDIESELSTRGGSAQEIFLRRLLTF